MDKISCACTSLLENVTDGGVSLLSLSNENYLVLAS